MAAPSKYNWDELRIEYISTKTSYRKLSEKYGISRRAVENRATAENWREMREQHQKKIFSKKLKKAEQLTADKEVKEISMLKKSANKLVQLVDNKIDAAMTGSSEINSRAIKELVSSVKDLTAVIRDIYEIPTEQDRLSMEAIKARMKAEKHEEQRIEIQFTEKPEDEGWHEA